MTMRIDGGDVAGGLGRTDQGTATMTIAGAAASITVTHKLGVKPRRILVTARTAPFGAYAGTALCAYSETTKDFGLYGFNLNGYTGGVSVLVDWVAIA